MARDWLRMWHGCHVASSSGPVRIAWPDGGAYLDQPVIVIEVFEFIAGIVDDLLKMERNRT